jgi:hypothetical protein
VTATDVCEVERLTRALEAAEQEAAMLQAEAEDAKAGALEVVLEAAQDRAESERFRAQLAEARKVSEAAHYLVGNPDCIPGDDDPTCPEYFTDGGESPSGVEYCSHVEHRYATWADRYAREHLDEALRDVQQQLKAGAATTAELVESIDDTFESLRQYIYMEIPDSSGGGWSGYSPADIRTAAAQRDAARERWEGSDGVATVREALNRAGNAEHEVARLKRELRDVLKVTGVVLRTPAEWLSDTPEVTVLDWAGWDGAGGRSREDRLTRDEFLERRSRCNVTRAVAEDVWSA